jgi:hypothetical protein
LQLLSRDRPLAGLILLAIAMAIRQAVAVERSEYTIVPGIRVGLIEPGMTAEALERAYGKTNVRREQMAGAEGETVDGARVFADTDHELEVIWDSESPTQPRVFDVRIIGSAWTFENGLRPGLSIEQVEEINGRPFTILGFGWDYGGYAIFKGGTLDAKIGLRFTPASADIPESLQGDIEISSTDAKLRALNPVVEAPISVFMGAPAPQPPAPADSGAVREAD